MRRPYLKSDLTYHADVSDNLEEVAKQLKREIKYIDLNGLGLTVELEDGIRHPEKQWVAWVDSYYRVNAANWEEYYLRISVDNQQVLNWSIYRYNSNSMVTPLWMRWYGDELVMVYMEKHRVYGVTTLLSEVKKLQELAMMSAEEICIADDILYVVPLDYQGYLKQFKIPDWTPLDPLPEAKAREMGLLEENTEE